MSHRKVGKVVVAVLVSLLAATPSFAYRPFDGTDAAVADPGELEIEFQPAGSRHDDFATKLIAPGTVLNYGFMAGWEAVLEGQLETPLSSNGPSSFSESGAFLKHVVIPGSLREKAGPSFATEFGVLFPDTNNPTSGYGASVSGIVSERFAWGTVHLNGQVALTREHDAGVFTGIILEGPSRWTVRPVAEFFYDNQFGTARTISALVGAIWQVQDNFAFDVGVREALTNGRAVNEIRAGLTFGFPPIALGPSVHR